MPKTKKSVSTRHFCLLLFEGFSNLCLANAVEPLRAANTLSKKQLYTWQYLGLSASPLCSSSGLPVQTEQLSGQIKGDFLIVMPSYGYQALDTPECRQKLRAADNRFGTMAGLDTGSWLLAAAGLLDGYCATSHWDVISSLSETFPEVNVVEDRFVLDRNRVSSGGASTTLELMFELIETHHGSGLALEVAALFMYGERDPRSDPLRLMSTNQTVKAAAALMRRHIEDPLSIAQISKGVGKRQRSLELAFQKHAGRTPIAIYRSIRLAEARRRLEQTRQRVAEISSRCGYADPTAMSRAFKAEFGLSPTAARRLALG